MNMIEHVTPGRKILASAYNQLVDAVNENAGVNSPDSMFYDSNNGRVVQSPNRAKIKEPRHTAFECQWLNDQDSSDENKKSAINVWMGDDFSKLAMCGGKAISAFFGYEEGDFVEINKDQVIAAGGWYKFKDSYDWNGVGAKFCKTGLSSDPYVLALADPEDFPEINDTALGQYAHCSAMFDSPIWLATNTKSSDLSGSNLDNMWTGALIYNEGGTGGALSVDSEIKSLKLSSLMKVSCEIELSALSGESEKISADAYTFFEFDKGQRLTLSEALAKEKSARDSAPSCRVDLVLRVGKASANVSAETKVEYLGLSDLILSCDTDFYNKEPKEMQSTSIERTSAEKGQPALQLKGFKDEGTSSPESYSLIVRESTEDGEKVLRYVEPIGLIQVDNDISSVHRSSLQKKDDPSDPDKKFVQLYRFDNPGNTVLSVDKYTRSLPEGYKLLVRHQTKDEDDEDSDVLLEYADLSIDVGISADTDVFDQSNTKSIDQDSDNHFLRLHNFEVEGANTTFHPNQGTSYLLPDEGKELLYRDGDELKYCNVDFNDLVDEALSGAQKLYKADSEFPDEQLSSLERREQTVEEEGKTLKRQEFSMYRFNQSDYKQSRAETLDDSTVLVREKLTGGQTILRYVDLSAFETSISGDVDIDQEGQKQKSVEIKMLDGDDKQKYAQLYNFESTTADVTIDLKNQEESGEKYHFLVKKVSDGKLNELQYAEVSAVLSAEVDDKSIEVNEDNQKLQLKYFDQDSYNNITLSGGQWFDLSGKQCLVGKNLETGEVNYYNFKVDLSANAISVDTEVRQDGNYATQSIDEAYSTEDKAHFHRLHNFDMDSALEKEDWEDTMHVLVRQKEDSNLTLEYIKLTDLSGSQLSVDSEIENSTKSIEKNDDVLRLYNFGAGNTDLTVALDKDSPETSSSINVLVRDGTELKYAALSIDFANGSLSADSQIDSIQQKSIDAKYSDDLSADYFQLHNFDDSSRDVTLSIDNENRELPDGYSILVRRTTGDGDTVLDYANLSIGLSAEQLSCDDKSTEINPDSKKLQIYGFQDISHTTITLDRENPVVDKDEYRFITKDKAQDNITQTVLSIKFDEPISVDTACDNFDSNSLDVYYSQEQEANVIKINGFDDKENEEVETVSADADSYDVLMRHHTTGGAVDTAYLNVAALLSTSVPISCDSQGTTNKKSMAYNTAGELELYNFHNTGTDLTVSHAAGGYTPTNQLVLVKNTSNGQLQYARLYTNTRTDTSCDSYSNSIEYNTSYNAIKINGWNTKSNTAASTVSANAGNYDVLMRRHSGSYYYTEYMNIAPLLSGGAQPQGETTDLTVITQVVWDTSTHRIQPKGKKLSFVNGLLSTVSDTEFNVGGINTTPWTGE